MPAIIIITVWKENVHKTSFIHVFIPQHLCVFLEKGHSQQMKEEKKLKQIAVWARKTGFWLSAVPFATYIIYYVF